MIAALVASLLIQPSDPRAIFIQKIAQVKDHWTPDQVKALLGPPDDIWQGDDPHGNRMFGDITWCYGTNGHHTLPTLGQITFRKGEVEFKNAPYDSPPPSLITEQELQENMRFIYDRDLIQDNLSTDINPLSLIQLENKLRPLGKDKILAVLDQYSQLEEYNFDNEQLFWLTRVLFKSNKPGGIFTIPAAGSVSPPPPADLTKWPTYPVIITEGIPITIYQGAALAGVPEPLSYYIKHNRDDWTLADSLPQPPDDPYLAATRLLKSKAWPFPYKADPRYYEQAEKFPDVYLQQQIVLLTQTAFLKKPKRIAPYEDPNLFEQDHQEFLNLGGHWDAAKQMYVRKDGTFTIAQHYDYKEYSYTYQGVPNTTVKGVFHRSTEDRIDFYFSIQGVPGKPTPPLIFQVETTQPGPPLWEGSIAGQTPSSATDSASVGYTSACTLPPGQPTKFVIILNHIRYESPLYTL